MAATSVEEATDQIGEQLRMARESAGLVVEDIVFQTRIPKSVVKALEAGDFSVFSSPTYARSFLSQYSGFLEVDASLWMDALEPIAYASGDVELSTGGSGYSRRSVVQAAPESSGSWLAGAGMLAISCGFIFAAIKGYEFLEHKLGSEAKPTLVGKAEPAAPPEMAAAATASPPVLATVEESRQTAALPQPGIVEPPPRATVVRDDR